MVTSLHEFKGWEDMDRNNALNLTEKQNYIIETYGISPVNDCICGHRYSHHGAAAFGRGCEVCGWFGEHLCVRYTSARGVVPHRRLSAVSNNQSPPRSYRRAIQESLDWQHEKTAKLVQEAIERIWSND